MRSKKVFFVFLFSLSLLGGFSIGQQCGWFPPAVGVPVQEKNSPILGDWARTDPNPLGPGFIISYGPSFYTLPPCVQIFTRAHEYSHIDLGHYPISVSENRTRELEADTHAAEWLIQSGCKQCVIIMADYFGFLIPNEWRLPPYYPPYGERRQNLINILNSN